MGHATALKLAVDAMSKRGPFGLRDPKAEYLFHLTGLYVQCEVHGIVLRDAFVADLDTQRVEGDRDIHGLEWPLLLCVSPGQRFLGDGADQVERHRHLLALLEECLELARAQATPKEHQHRYVEAS